MSLILDALKKLDREKSTRRDRTANIAADILGPDLPRPGKRDQAVCRYGLPHGCSRHRDHLCRQSCSSASRQNHRLPLRSALRRQAGRLHPLPLPVNRS